MVANGGPIQTTKNYESGQTERYEVANGQVPRSRGEQDAVYTATVTQEFSNMPDSATAGREKSAVQIDIDVLNQVDEPQEEVSDDDSGQLRFVDDEPGVIGNRDGLSPTKSVLISKRYITAQRAIDECAEGIKTVNGILQRTTSVISPICTNGDGNHCTTDFAEDDHELLQHRSVLAAEEPRLQISQKS